LNASGEIEEEESENLLAISKFGPAAVGEARELGGRELRDVCVEMDGLAALLGNGDGRGLRWRAP